MTKYIPSEAAFNAILKLVPKVDEDGYCWVIRGDAARAIDTIPAADVRPVVLCRDCQNSYEWANVDGDNYRYCGYLRSRWNHDADRMVDDDDFCKWGRKKEADNV